MRKFEADQAVVHHPEKLLVLDVDLVDAVEGPQNLLVGFEAERAQKHRAVELALAVDAHIKQVLEVVFELHPAPAVGNDFAEEVSLRRNALEEHAGRAVQLRNDDALGAIDDEGAVVRHQRNFAEEDFLLLNVAHALGAGLGIFGVHRQANGDFERRGICHAAVLALHHVVLQLQTDRVAALVAERDYVLVERAAVMAQHIAGVKWIGANGRAARRVAASGAQMVQAFQVAALALPVADRVVHELQLAHAAKIGDRKYRIENCLQTGIFPLIGEQVHLQEPLVRMFLNLDQVRNRNRRFNLREIHSLWGGAISLTIHLLLLRAERARLNTRVKVQ